MRLVKSLLLAGAAVAGLGLLASVLTPTLAREPNTHRLTVRMPDGGLETIEYSGHVVPRLIVQQAPAHWQPFAIAWPTFPSTGSA